MLTPLACTLYDYRIAGVNRTITANFNMPLATGYRGYFYALCCDHFMHNIGFSYCLTTKRNKKEWIYIYTHTYIYIHTHPYISIYIHMYMPTVY